MDFLGDMAFGAIDLANDGWMLGFATPRHQPASLLHQTTHVFVTDHTSDSRQAKKELDMLDKYLTTLEDGLKNGSTAPLDVAKRDEIGKLASGIMARVVRPGVRTSGLLKDRHATKISKRIKEKDRGFISDETPRYRELHTLGVDEKDVKQVRASLKSLRERYDKLDDTLKIDQFGRHARAKAMDTLSTTQRFVGNHRLAVIGPVGAFLVLGTLASLLRSHKKQS